MLVMYNEYYGIFIQNDRYDRFVDMKERTSSWRTREERFCGSGWERSCRKQPRWQVPAHMPAEMAEKSGERMKKVIDGI